MGAGLIGNLPSLTFEAQGCSGHPLLCQLIYNILARVMYWNHSCRAWKLLRTAAIQNIGLVRATNIKGKPKWGPSSRGLKIQCYVNMIVELFGVDGSYTWVLDKQNNVSCIAGSFCYQDVTVVFAWTWVVQVLVNKSTALLIWRVRWGLISELSDRRNKTPLPRVNPWQHYR